MAKKAESQEKQGKIEEFFDLLGNKSTSTKSGYNSAIWQFFQFTLKLTDAEKPTYGARVDQYFEEKSTTEVYNDFKKYVQQTMQDKAPLGALQVFNQIQNFFKYTLDQPMTPKQLKMIKNQLPTGGKISQETTLTHDMINSMLEHTDTKGRAIILTLASSGMRIGELLKITCKDVKFPTSTLPVTTLFISAKNTKNGHQRHTHCSSEATAALRAWIAIRPAYIRENMNRGKGLNNQGESTKDAGSDLLFPMSDHSVNEMIAALVVKVTGDNAKDENTGRAMIHPHSFRKFFDTQLVQTIPKGVVDALTGHLTLLEATYRQMTPEETARHYMKGEHLLFVAGVPELREAATTNTKETSRIDGELRTAQNQLLNMMVEKDQLREKVRKQEDRLNDLQGALDAVLTHLKTTSSYQDEMSRRERDRAIEALPAVEGIAAPEEKE